LREKALIQKVGLLHFRNRNQIQADFLAERELIMYKFYMGLWWFCFIQWPLFMFLGWANNKHLYSCLTESFVCKLDTYYVMYMFFFSALLDITHNFSNRYDNPHKKENGYKQARRSTSCMLLGAVFIYVCSANIHRWLSYLA
jgi:cellulose synthase/poly-beta-1,6-N-acetylglucosamine synthase-like glycosyltransferase